MKTLFNHFEILEDPRDTRGKKYKLIDNYDNLWNFM